MSWQIVLCLSAALVAATNLAQNTLEDDLQALPGNEPLIPPAEITGIINEQMGAINLIGNSEENEIIGETTTEEPEDTTTTQEPTTTKQGTTEKTKSITEDPSNVSQKLTITDNKVSPESGPEVGSNGGDEGNIEGDGDENNEVGGGGGDQEEGGSGDHNVGGGGDQEAGDGGDQEVGGSGNQEAGGGGDPDVGGGEGGGSNQEEDCGGGCTEEIGGAHPDAVGEAGGGGGAGDNNDPEAISAQSHQNIEDEVICEGVHAEDVTIETTTGQVQGNCWKDKPDIISYIDIPYGSFNMFEDPVPPKKLDSIHEQKVHEKRCPQMEGNTLVGHKECLTLSIFKPLEATDASVLFHIHEGYFSTGSGNPAIYGPEHLVLKGVILILPNYRLGPLGFLCLHNTTAPGNAALKDLTLALNWVHDNIKKFGGNPAKIAVSGDGTAGALAGYLALSPISKNYVSKVITESGSVLSHWAIDRTPMVIAASLARAIGEFESWTDVEIDTVIRAGRDLTFRPCIERNMSDVKNFMLATPWEMIENQEFATAFIIGSAQYAGVHDFINDNTITIQGFLQDIGRLIPNDLKFQNINERNSVAEQIKNQYFNESVTIGDVQKLATYFTDFAYLSPSIRTARSLVNSGATVFFYEFSFVGGFNRELLALEKPQQEAIKGAIKRDIVGYLFMSEDHDESNVPAKDQRMVDQLTDLWISFLKHGQPSVNMRSFVQTTEKNIMQWNKFENTTDSNEEWLSIGDPIALRKGLHVERLRLWTEVYDKHFIEHSLASGFTPSVYTVLVLQVVFLLSFFRNASHFIH